MTIFFLCTSGASQRHVEKIQHAQRRLAVLKRLSAGLQTLAAVAQDSMAQPAEGDETGESADLTREVEGDVRAIFSEGQLDQDLKTAMAEMSVLKQKLDEARRSRKLMSSVLQRVRGQLERCVAEAGELSAEVEESERELKEVLEQLPQLKAGKSDRTNMELLKRIVSTLATQSGGALAEKIRAPFAQLMLRNVRSRSEMAKKYRASIRELEAEYENISARLEKNYQIHISLDRDAPMAFVRGRFQAGVLITGDAYLFDSEEGQEDIVRAPESLDHARVYRRLPSGAVAEDREAI
jgi:chromosome segregation ATPase